MNLKYNWGLQISKWGPGSLIFGRVCFLNGDPEECNCGTAKKNTSFCSGDFVNMKALVMWYWGLLPMTYVLMRYLAMYYMYCNEDLRNILDDQRHILKFTHRLISVESNIDPHLPRKKNDDDIS